jgi:hypothetical protein
MDDGARRASASPRPLLPRYAGPDGFALTFFDDCRCEFDGDDSVHFDGPYIFDEVRGTLRIDGTTILEGRADGSFVEARRRDAALFARLANDGRWFPVDDHGAEAAQAHPRFPQACRSTDSASAKMGPKR